jgi:hypothetical protein
VEQNSTQDEVVSVHSIGPSDGSGEYHYEPGDGMDTDRNGGHNKEPPTNPQGSDVNQMGNQRGQKTRQNCGVDLGK